MIKIGITGSRTRDTYDDFKILETAIWDFITQNKIDIDIVHLIYGGAYEGADKFAEQICKQYNFDSTVYRPKYKTWGKRAPIIRNTKIADESEYLFAVWDKKSKGTEDTMDKFLKNHPREKLILLIPPEPEQTNILTYTEDDYSF